MKIFISQPMRGKTSEEILEVRKEAVERVQKMYPDTEVVEIDSYCPQNLDHDVKNPRVWALGGALQKLAEADLAVFAPGWAEAFGCTIEHQCAVGYGINTMELLF